MFFKSKVRSKPESKGEWLRQETRHLRDAARIASLYAEHHALPITRLPGIGNDQWHCRQLLYQGAVRGIHADGRHAIAISATRAIGLRLAPDASFLYDQSGYGVNWHNLQVDHAAFTDYLHRLHSYW